MQIRVRRWLAVVASCGLLSAGVSAAATVAAHATGETYQPGPFEVGNLLDYANSDFEGTIGNWVSVSNSTLTDDPNHQFLHDASLLDTVPSGSTTSSFRISGTPNPIDIDVHAGDTYRIGAYFKAPAVSGQTVRFSLNCYNDTTGYIGTVTLAANTLANSTKWQYSEDDFKAPTNLNGNGACDYVQGAPEVTLSNLPASNAAVNMDEVIFAPDRAALIIGAHGTQGADGQPGYDAQDWIDANETIGPLQSDKEFYEGNGTPALPTSFDQTNCYGIEKTLGLKNYAAWPACVITYHTTDATTLEDFVSSIPSQQMVIMVFWNEPEANTGSFGTDSQCKNETGGADFQCEFELQAGYIRSIDAPNVFVAEDSSGDQYAPGGNGLGPDGSCPYIVPTTSTDFYLVDHYDENANGSDLPNEASGRGTEWTNWLNCVQDINKPLGLGEYGLDCTSASGGPNQSVVAQEMAADNGYLGAIPGATEPTIMWAYWYGVNNQNGNNCVFTNQNTIDEWQSIETQNGGG